MLWNETLDFVSKSINGETITGRKTFNSPTSSTTSSVNISRDANYTGGTKGYVNSGLYVYDVVRNGVTAFEWAITASVQNYATAGENVGIYGQGWKFASGATWAGCFEARDKTNQDATTSGGALIGLEVDVFANGTDSTIGSRVGVDIVGGKGTDTGLQAEVHAGLRIGAMNGDETQAKFRRGIDFEQNVDTGLYFASTGNVGIDFSNGSYPTALKLKGNDYIQLGTNAKMKYNSSNNYIEFYNGSTRVGYIDLGGADHAL